MKHRAIGLGLLATSLCMGGCWNREAVWEATDAHRSSVARPGESEAERLYRLGHDCMEVIERDDCAIDYFEQLVGLESNNSRRDLLGDATFRLVELYRRHDKADDATLLLRKFWELGMDYASAGVVPYGTRFAPASISTMFMVDVADLQQSGLHASLPQDAKDMMFTCDDARREQLEADAKARREARREQRLAAMSTEEREAFEKKEKQRRERFSRSSSDDKSKSEKPKVIYADGFCALAAALELGDPRGFSRFLGASNHEDPTQSVALVNVEDVETKLAAAVEAGRLVAEATPAIEGRDLDAMTSIMRNKLRVWSLPEFEYQGQPAKLLSFDRNELMLAPAALVPELLYARAHDETRLHPKLRDLLGQVPPDVVFMTLITPMAAADFMKDLGAMGKLLPNPDGLMIAAVVYDYAGLFIRVPTEDSVKAWVLLSLARKLISNREDELSETEGADEGEAAFMGNLDISQTTDGKALMMTNILTTAAVTRMFLGG